MGIKWSDYITNDEVCTRAGSSEMRIILTRRQLCWAGHVVRMDEGRLPTENGELASGTRDRGRQKLRFKDTLKSNISSCGLPKWETAATNRSKRRMSVFEGTKVWKEVRVAERREDRLRRKEPAQAAPTGFSCHICRRPCKGNAGLQAHLRLGHR